MKRAITFAAVLVTVGRGPGVAQPLELTGGNVVPSGAWVDPDFGDSTHFLLMGAEEWRETAVLWFDTQLLNVADAYAEVAPRYSGVPRSELRARVIDRLQDLSRHSWTVAEAAIDSLVDAGSVVRCRPMWIVNGASCTLERDQDPRVLADIPGVVRVFRGMPERAFPLPDTVGPRFVDEGSGSDLSAGGARIPWNLSAMGVPLLWDEGLTGSGVQVVVHDGGFNLGAEPTRANLWRNASEVPGNGVDDDGNGYVDDVHGFQFDAGNADIHRAQVLQGQLVHGNATAALAVGRQTIDTGVRLGAAPEARWAAVMAVRNFHEALEWALLHDFDVYGMSFSYPGLGATRSHFRRMLEHAALAGLFLVSGAGNFGDPQSPGFVPVPVQLRTPEDVPLAVLAVAGVDSTGAPPAFSSRGPVEWSVLDYDEGVVPKPDVTTLNADLIVPDVRGAQATAAFRGNSFAAAQLVGVIALLVQAAPEVNPWTLREILMETASDLGDRGFDPKTGAGLIDAPAALTRLRALLGR